MPSPTQTQAALTVTCSDVGQSDCMPKDEAAVDAQLTIVFDGKTYECSVTLVPGRDGVLSTWGSCRDHWADDATMGALDAWADGRDADGWERDARTMINEIEGAVAAAA